MILVTTNHTSHYNIQINLDYLSFSKKKNFRLFVLNDVILKFFFFINHAFKWRLPNYISPKKYPFLYYKKTDITLYIAIKL